MKWYRLYKIFGWLVIGVACLLLILPKVVPYFSPDQTTLTHWVAKQIPYPIKVENVHLSWERFNPIISLENVEIFTQDNLQALHVHDMKLVLNLWQCLWQRLQLDEVIIEGANVGIEYDQGHFHISGLPEFEWDLNSKSAMKVPFVKQLLIQKSNIHLMLGKDRSLPLTAGRLWIEVRNHIRIRGAATVVGLTPAFFNFSIDIPLQRPNEASIYCHWYGGELNQFAHFFPEELPLIFQKGRLGMQAWITLREKQAIELTAEMQLQDVAMTTKTSDTLAFDNIQGRFQAKRQEQGWLIEGTNWELKEKDDEQALNPLNEAKVMNFLLTTHPCADTQCWDVETENLNIQQWSHWLEKLALIEQPSWLKPLQPRGWLDYLHLAVARKNEGWTIQTAEGVFTDAQLEPGESSPGFSPLSGAVSYDGQKGKVLLQSDRMNFTYPKIFASTFVLSNVACLLDWHPEHEEIILQARSLQARLNKTLVRGAGTMRFQGAHLPEVELLVEAGNIPMQQALAVLPRHVMDKDLVKWLERALHEGDILSSTLVLRGDLAKFPFDTNDGIFEISADVQRASLNYDPHWPMLADLDAELLFHNRSLVIMAQQGKVAGGKLAMAQAVIPDLGAPVAMLNVEAKVESTLPNGVAVIQKSPLQHLAKTLAPFSLHGDMDLSLGLDVPLSAKHLQELKVRGLLEVNKADVNVPAWDLEINALEGDVSFSESSIQSEDLKGIWFNQPTQFRLESPNKDELHVIAEGKMTLKELQEWLKVKSVPQLNGETDYAARLVLNSEQTNLSVNSSLQGIAVTAPPPFGKKAEATRPLELRIHRDPNQLMRIAAKLGDDVDLAYSLDAQGNQYQGRGGHLHFGINQLAKFREDQIFLIDGEIADVDFDAWNSFLKETGLLSTTMQGSPPMGLEPLVELKMGSVKLLGNTFAKTKMEAQWEAAKHLWHVNFDGPALRGNVKVPQGEKQPISVDLKKLILITNNSLQDIFSEKKPLERPIDLKIQDFTFDKKHILDLNARLEPVPEGIAFPRFKAKLKNTEVNLTGGWDYLAATKLVKAQGKMTTRNITDTLDSLGMNGSLRGAKGDVGFSVQWQGSPAKWDYPTLEGSADFTLKQGYINGVNPGLGRVLNLLNLDNVRRRLNLDFSDITKSGFAFDELTGKFQLNKGKISSNKILLQGPAAKIEAIGQADLSNQGLDGELVVMPNVTGSLPVAAAIAAGNPAVGAAVWVVDKMFGNKIQEINRFKYRVQGTWQAPIIQEIAVTTGRE